MRKIIVGLTEKHGMALEQSMYSPDGFDYEFLETRSFGSSFFQSPIKGFFSSYEDQHCDFVEAVLSPVNTKKDWLYSLACFEEAIAFQILGVPTPRWIRLKLASNLIFRDNFKGFLFWSKAGLDTLKDYDFPQKEDFLRKSHVCYPGVNIPENFKKRKPGDELQILFNGNFFIKGGANVVDSFEMLQKDFGNIKLRLCCDKETDFEVGDKSLKKKYLTKIENNRSITIGRVSRQEFLETVLPNTDIYLLPTYGDAFGFAVLEAMAYGIPVVSTNYMAIPEMVEHGVSGYLADISSYDCKQLFKGCFVKALPNKFKNDLNSQIIPFLRRLISSESLRIKFGSAGQNICREKFSFKSRSRKLKEIYDSIY